jgi:hypothetical protein
VREAISTILDTLPKGAGVSGGLSREEIVDRLCEDLLCKVGARGPQGGGLLACQTRRHQTRACSGPCT